MKLLRLLVLLASFFLIFSGCQTGKNELLVLSAPAGSLYTVINKNGTTVLPNGRLLTPSGKSLIVAPHPFGLALSCDGEMAVTANSGVSPLSISIIHKLTTNPEIIQVPPGYSSNTGILESVFMGLAITPDNKKVYVAAGQDNSILVFYLLTGNKIDSVDCSVSANGTKFPDGYIGDMTLSRDGNHLFAVDQTNFRLVIVDTRKMQVINSVPVGRYPFGVALSHDEKKVYVANVGMFQYSKIGNIEKESDYKKALAFPAFGYNTEEMKNGIITDSLVIPGLGDPNSDKAFSVWAISIEDIDYPKVTARIKTGNLVGQMVEGIPAVGGSSPNSLVATSDWLFASNGKGYGSGPNGGKNFKEGGEGTYIGNLMKGTVSVIKIPSEKDLRKMTAQVISNNFFKQKAAELLKSRKDNPIPLYGGQKESPIKHIVFISKENRTYDEIFGQLKNSKGDASLARYGHNVSFSNRANTMRVEDATIMANHHKLAEQFAIGDNFYVDSDVSADGHRWLVNTYPNEWVETCTPASYGGNRDYKPASKAPGSLGMNGSAGAIYPEDYNESGSMWD